MIINLMAMIISVSLAGDKVGSGSVGAIVHGTVETLKDVQVEKIVSPLNVNEVSGLNELLRTIESMKFFDRKFKIKLKSALLPHGKRNYYPVVNDELNQANQDAFTDINTSATYLKPSFEQKSKNEQMSILFSEAIAIMNPDRESEFKLKSKKLFLNYLSAQNNKNKIELELELFQYAGNQVEVLAFLLRNKMIKKVTLADLLKNNGHSLAFNGVDLQLTIVGDVNIDTKNAILKKIYEDAFYYELKFITPSNKMITYLAFKDQRKVREHEENKEEQLKNNPLRISQIPGMDNLLKTIDSMQIFRDQFKAALKYHIMYNEKRYYYQVDENDVDANNADLVKKKYASLYPHNEIPLVINALTNKLTATTYLLPSFYKNSLNAQTCILFHEGLWLLYPEATEAFILKAEQLFSDYLENNSHENELKLFYHIGNMLDIINYQLKFEFTEKISLYDLMKFKRNVFDDIKFVHEKNIFLPFKKNIKKYELLNKFIALNRYPTFYIEKVRNRAFLDIENTKYVLNPKRIFLDSVSTYMGGATFVFFSDTGLEFRFHLEENSLEDEKEAQLGYLL